MKKKDIQTGHDPVNNPKHYLSHPSGVECIELSEVLSFNVGNAFKYVFRRDDKANPSQDLEKAKWYINREIERLKLFKLTPLRFQDSMVANPDFGLHHVSLARLVCNAERVLAAQGFYARILSTGPVFNYIETLVSALPHLQTLIDSYRVKEK